MAQWSFEPGCSESALPHAAQTMTDTGFLEQVDQAAADPSRVLELTLSHFRADTGTLHEMGPDGLLHLKAWAGGIPEQLLPIIETIPVGKGIAGLAVERQEPVNMCNLQADQSGDVRPRAKETGVQGSICVPLMTGGKAVGALGVATRQARDFSDSEIALLLEVGQRLTARPAS